MHKAEDLWHLLPILRAEASCHKNRAQMLNSALMRNQQIPLVHPRQVDKIGNTALHLQDSRVTLRQLVLLR